MRRVITVRTVIVTGKPRASRALTRCLCCIGTHATHRSSSGDRGISYRTAFRFIIRAIRYVAWIVIITLSLCIKLTVPDTFCIPSAVGKARARICVSHIGRPSPRIRFVWVFFAVTAGVSRIINLPITVVVFAVGTLHRA